MEPNLDFDYTTLTLNRKYIQIDRPEQHLPMTAKKIYEFSTEHTIVCKMQRLREIRENFLREIE